MAKTLAKIMGTMLAATALPALAQTRAPSEETGWPSVNYDLAGTRFSPLSQITPDNVDQLQIAWTYHLKPPVQPDQPVSSRFLLSQAIPLVIGSTMYLPSPYGRIVSLDATTGQEKWVFEIPDRDTASLRGVAYWPGDDQVPASIIFGTRQGKLMSLNAETGQPNPGFGDSGTVNLKTPEVMVAGMDDSYILPSPPTIYKNLVITGAGQGEGPGGLNGGDGPAGDTRAWDARTGELVWTFHTIPKPGEFGFDTWGGDSWKNRSGVNVWGYMTVDAERGILYMPLGAPNNDRVGVDRPGDNLFSSSLVAVDADTGKYLWHFQVVHHDVWDVDTQAPPTLIDVTQDGKFIPAVVTVNKNGLMFILDRVTGEPIYGVEERPVPASTVPGEQLSPTQPFPVKPEPLAQTELSRDNLYQGEPEHQKWCEELVDDNDMHLGPLYMPLEVDRYTVSLPGTQGGVNYYGGAYDPERGLFVANVNNLAQPMRLVLGEDGAYVNSGPLAGTRRFWNPDTHNPCGPTPWGQLVAVDVNSGTIAWRTTLGVTDSFPEGLRDTGRPGLGGTTLTTTGLSFVGATDDNRFRAFDTSTGRKLWETMLPASAEATPITYADTSGKQYVAIVATGGGLIGAKSESDQVMVFTLP